MPEHEAAAHHATHGAYPDLVLTRTFDAPRSVVFRAWTESARIAQWWGPHGFTNPVCEVDPRPGGAMRIDMRGPDGTVYPTTGRYEEIVEPERIVFTAGALDPHGRVLFAVRNTVVFAEQGRRTVITLTAHVVTATPEAARYLSGQEAGWRQSLERLASYVAAA